MSRPVLAALLLSLSLAAGAAADKKADDKKAPKKPIGTWVREAGNTTITFAIKADGLTIHVKAGADKFVKVEAEYAITRDGKTLFATARKVEKKGIDSAPDKGDLFGFQFSVTKEELTISDLKGTGATDEGRRIVEGVYSAKKD